MQNIFLKLRVKAQVALASLKSEEGQDLIEYALLAALIALAAITAMSNLGTQINSKFTAVSSSLAS